MSKSVKTHPPGTHADVTQSRQRVARATQVAQRRGVTPYPVLTPLQAHQRRYGSLSHDRDALERSLYGFRGAYNLSPRDREILRGRRDLLEEGRYEHGDYLPDDPVDVAPKEPDDSLYEEWGVDRRRLRHLERLETMDRDETLQSFEDSDVQHQLGAGIVAYD